MKLSEAERAIWKRIQSAGGFARAKKLSKRRKVEIAKLAAKARWDAYRAEKAAS